MKTLIPTTILIAMVLLAGCTAGNPALDPVLTFTDGPAPSATIDGSTGGSSREPVVEDDGSTDDVRHLREVDGSAPDEGDESDASPSEESDVGPPEPEGDAALEPEGDATTEEPDAATEPESDAATEPEPDAALEPEGDAAVEPEPDAAPELGCMADPGACPAGTVCSFDTHECVENCGDPEVVGYMVCTGQTPFCIPPGPHGFAPRCGQCYDDSYCSGSQHCTNGMCE